jgi:glycosyltransferase involved in cell wall biosynthesis
MGERPEVAVIIPVFDRVHCVADAVASVLAQGDAGVAVQVIVVDDGSSDGSADVVRAVHADDPRVVVLQQTNLGPSAARNHGIAAATAPLVTFLDSDDVMVPGGLAVQVAHLRAPGGPDAVVASCRLVHVEGSVPDWAMAVYEQATIEPVWVSLLTDRPHLEAIAGFDESMWMGEDLDLIARYRESGRRLDVIDHVVVHRRRYGDNLTKDLQPDGSDLREVLRRATARKRAGGPPGLPALEG